MRTTLSVSILLSGLIWVVPVSADDAGVDSLVADLQSKLESTRLEAIDQLTLLGEKATAAAGPLAELLEDEAPRVRAHAAAALGRIGSKAQPVIESLMRASFDDESVVRREAVEALQRIQPGSEVTLPLLAKLLEDTDPAVTVRALDTIADLGKRALPLVSEALKNEKTAYWACLAVSEIGPDAAELVDLLLGLVEGDDPGVKREAILALAAIGPAAVAAVPVLGRTLEDEVNRVPATYALGSVGSVPGEIEAVIAENVDDADQVLGTVSAWTLARLHRDNKAVVRETTQRLVKNLTSGDPRVRLAAGRALIALDPDPEISRPLLEEVLDNVQQDVLTDMLDSLAQLGPIAVPRLIKALDYERARPHVIYILGQIGPEAEPAVPALLALMGDDDEAVCRETLIALAKIGPAAEEAVAPLVEALGHHQGPMCYGVCYALGRIGPAAVKAKPVLLRTMAGSDGSAAFIAAWALTRIDPTCPMTAEISTPILMAGLQEADPGFRLQAAAALKSLGPLARGATAALQRAIEDEDPFVREAAAEALEAIGP